MAKNKANSSQAQKQETSPFPVFDPAEFMQISNRNLEVATRAASACLGGATQFNKEIIDFLNSRVKKDIATAQDIMSAKTSEEAFHCQAGFIETAIRDYADETSRIMNIAADIAKTALQPMEERTEEVLHYIDEHADDQKHAAE